MRRAKGGDFQDLIMPREFVPASRLFWMDTLRGLAAMSVMLAHYFWPMVDGPVHDYFDPGGFGVGVFFFISGYIVPLSIRKESGAGLLRFACSRFFRLYPVYWVSLLVGCLVYNPSPLVAFMNTTMIQRFLGVNDVIGVYWTLQIELLFYGFLAITIASGRFNDPRIVISCAIGSALLAIFLGCIRFFLLKKAPIAVPIGLSFILLGNLYSLARTGFLAQLLFMKVLAAVIACLIISFFLGYSHDWSYDENPMRFVASYGAAIMVFFGASRLMRRSIPLLSSLGLMSYPIYLLHQPIHLMVSNRFAGSGAVALNLSSILAVLLVAVSVHFVLEKPAIRLGRWIVDNKRSKNLILFSRAWPGVGPK